MRRITTLKLALLLILSPTIIFAHSSFTGYSGAPGSKGTCASTCHGTSGGTIEISGFPNNYVPGQTYTVNISHNGGDPIRNFNASTRLGTSTTIGGLLSAGFNTEVYSTFEEQNGVHLASTNLDNGTFEWTAPEAGSGAINLYVAGLQGGFTGVNTALTLTATEGAPTVSALSKGSILFLIAVFLVVGSALTTTARRKVRQEIL